MPPGWCGTSVTPAPSSSAPRSTDSEADREVLLRTRSLTAANLDERPVLLAIGLLGALWGIAVAAGGLTSFYLCATLIACSLIVVDFRIGVVLLILLMPISGSSTLFPHEMFGVVGLNPLNLLLVGTLFSCLLHAAADRSLPQFLPQPLLWLYIVPIVIAGAVALALFTWSGAGSRGLRRALLLALGLSLVALVLTFSRGGFVAMAVATVLYVLRRFSARTLIITCVAVGGVLLFAPHAIYERLSAGHGQGIDAISAGRVNGLWLPLLPEVLRHPLIGNGIGAMLWSDTMRRGAGSMTLAVTHPHNAFLQAALDMGLTGLVLLCAYFAHAWRGLRARANDPDIPAGLRGVCQGAAAGLVGMLISDFTDSSLTPRPEQAFLWLAIGMMYGYRGRQSGAADIAQDESAQDEPAQDEPRGGRT